MRLAQEHTRPRMTRLSFTAMGTPSSGDRFCPFARRASASAASRRASAG